MAKIDPKQLPEGAQKSIGETKEPVGVLQRFSSDGDMLKYQAAQAAQERGVQGGMYQTGGDMPADVLERVQQHAFRGLTGVSAQTIESIMQGGLQRDQAYVGSNAQWTGYYLEPGAKFILPLDTPLRNMLPRSPGVGIDQINWRAVTDFFGGSGPSVGAFILQQQGTMQKLSYNWADMQNYFRMLSTSDIVTYESEIYGQLFESADVRATVAAKLIPALMLGQEVWYINAASNLWAPPPPLATGAATGGTVTAATYWFLVTAVNANGETLAASPTAASVTTTGTTSSITLTIFRVPGAASYNVYVGTGSTQPANSAMWRQSATTQFGGATALNDPGGLASGSFTATMTAPPATSGTAYSTVVSAGNTAIAYKSTDANTLNKPLTFDGVQGLIYKYAGAASSMGVQGLTPLVQKPAAADGSLTQDDIDSWLESMFLNARANPGKLFCGVKDARTLTKIVSQGTNFRVVQTEGDGQGDLTAGFRATKYINQTTGRVMDIVMLPYLMQGTLIAGSMELPFPVSEITKPIWRIEANREMWAVEYPPDQSHQTQWMYSATSNETMIIQYLGGFGALNGIAPPAS